MKEKNLKVMIERKTGNVKPVYIKPINGSVETFFKEIMPLVTKPLTPVQIYNIGHWFSEAETGTAYYVEVGTTIRQLKPDNIADYFIQEPVATVESVTEACDEAVRKMVKEHTEKITDMQERLVTYAWDIYRDTYAREIGQVRRQLAMTNWFKEMHKYEELTHDKDYTAHWMGIADEASNMFFERHPEAKLRKFADEGHAAEYLKFKQREERAMSKHKARLSDQEEWNKYVHPIPNTGFALVDVEYKGFVNPVTFEEHNKLHLKKF